MFSSEIKRLRTQTFSGEAEKMAQRVEYLLFKQKDLSSNPQHVGMADCNPSVVVWNSIAGAHCTPAKL